MPVNESFGFAGLLRGNTQGKAFPQCVFDHWDMIKGLPLVDQKAQELVLGIRKRKGLKEEMPVLENYMDKLWFKKYDLFSKKFSFYHIHYLFHLNEWNLIPKKRRMHNCWITEFYWFILLRTWN